MLASARSVLIPAHGGNRQVPGLQSRQEMTNNNLPTATEGMSEPSRPRESELCTAGRSAQPPVDILMATHNGAKHLAAQIDSLLAQTYTNWRLIIRDDASRDVTVAIATEYSQRYPEKISIVNDDEGQLGACRCFARLLEHSTAEYTMFCDQDDIWLPQKVELSLSEITKLEKHSPGVPLLVFTDLTVVDEELGLLAKSLWEFERTNPCNVSPKLLMFDNVATGCTMILNRHLRNIVAPIPAEAIMHDWWVALVCSVHGHLSFLRDQTVLYRQHGRNEVGAQDNSLAFRVRRLLRSPAGYIARPKKMVRLIRAQTEKLLEHAESHVIRDPGELIPVRRYLRTSSLFGRKWCLVRYNMLSGSYIRFTKKLLFN